MLRLVFWGAIIWLALSALSRCTDMVERSVHSTVAAASPHVSAPAGTARRAAHIPPKVGQSAFIRAQDAVAGYFLDLNDDIAATIQRTVSGEPAAPAVRRKSRAADSVEAQLLELIHGATRSVQVTLRSPLDAALTQALLAARQRGVIVQVLLGMNTAANRATASALVPGGVTVRSNAKPAHAVNSAVLVDGRQVWRGNLATAATLRRVDQASSLGVSSATGVVRWYVNDWAREWKRAITWRAGK